jgi:hypothetical protein
MKENCDRLKHGVPTVWVLCDKHPKNPACYYWHADKKMVCMECFTQNHWSTKNMTQVQPFEVDEYCHRVIEKLMEIKLKADTIRELVDSYSQKTRPFNSAEFKEMVEEAFRFVELYAPTQEEKNKLNYDRVPLSLPEEKKLPEIQINNNPLALDEYAIKLFNMKLPEQELLMRWLDLAGHLPKFTLLYRGSRDTFKAARFHEICDNKGATLSIIKSKCGKVFGGYTS